MNKDQGTGIVERVLYGLIMALLAKAIAKGWITSEEAPYYAAGIVTAIGSVWAWWINRPKAIAQSAAAIPGTTVITTPDIAGDTPETNIVSNTATKVVSK